LSTQAVPEGFWASYDNGNLELSWKNITAERGIWDIWIDSSASATWQRCCHALDSSCAVMLKGAQYLPEFEKAILEWQKSGASKMDPPQFKTDIWGQRIWPSQ
jgi:hypothetical protein